VIAIDQTFALITAASSLAIALPTCSAVIILVPDELRGPIETSTLSDDFHAFTEHRQLGCNKLVRSPLTVDGGT
jgi:hypothetical protein